MIRSKHSFFSKNNDNIKDGKKQYAELLNAYAISEFVRSDIEPEMPSSTEYSNILKRIQESSQKQRIYHFSGKQLFRYVAAACVIFAFFTSAVWYIGSKTRQQKLALETVISTPTGQRTEIFLADGTQVWLNAGSRLTLSNSFQLRDRKVKLEGEAYFKVSHDKTHPFYVESSDLLLKVIGTEFDIKAYVDDTDIKVVLVDGSLELFKEPRKSEMPLIMEAGQLATFSRINNEVQLHSGIDTDLYTSWRNGEFKFYKMSFAEISKQLESNYGVKFIFKNEAIKKLTFTGSFHNTETLPDLMKIMAISLPFKYSITNDTVVIY